LSYRPKPFSPLADPLTLEPRYLSSSATFFACNSLGDF
jgi:hypothetical protein